MKVAVLSDNLYLTGRFKELLQTGKLLHQFTFFTKSISLVESFSDVTIIDLKKDWKLLLAFDLIFSIHCKQIFPAQLVTERKCINIHPGLNPYNRGWFPQVFSIINKMPAGATIHEIDIELDHGKIIVQKEVEVNTWDTSLSIYNRVLEAELKLLDEYLDKIIEGDYFAVSPEFEGNINLKKDFNMLCEINLNDGGTYQELIDKLRALNHGEYKNAFFIDPKTGKKIYVRLDLSKED